jgi:hypothetical protein
MSFFGLALKGDGVIRCAHPPQVFFQGTCPEKVMSLNFQQLRFENIKVMADAKTRKQLLSGCSSQLEALSSKRLLLAVLLSLPRERSG